MKKSLILQKPAIKRRDEFLAKRGLLAVLREAFRRHGLHRLEANIQPDNEASRQLVQRCGFRLEGFSPRYLKIAGRWRDHERWAITVEEWRRRLVEDATKQTN